MNNTKNPWPACTAESRPWTRWWWLGAAVDKQTITRLLEMYHRAGLGGVEITSVYGVKGQEHRNIEYLSERWLEMIRHAILEAHRLGMEVIGPTFRTVLSDVQSKGNELEIEVTNLSANRIRDLDRRGVEWRIFEDINFIGRQTKPFDASDWPVFPSGLLGPVQLTPLSSTPPIGRPSAG